VAFPKVLGIALSGFYLPLFMIIWLFIARAMSIELRHHAGDLLLVEVLDVGFVASSVGLPLLLGAALGNVVRGVPLQEGDFAIPLFLTADAASPVGVLDAFTLGAGILAVGFCMLHGACFVALRTTGHVAQRAKDWAQRLVPVVFGLWVLGLGLLRTQVPAMWSTLLARPAAVLPLVLAAGCLAMCFWAVRTGRELQALFGSTGFGFFVLVSIALCMFPHLLRDWADRAELALGTHNGAADPSSLRSAIYWFPVGVLVALGYLAMNLRLHRDRVPSKEAATH
jgi:cytochrome d ubiquinol oxidase subunit II